MSSAIVTNVGTQTFSTWSRMPQVEVGQVLVDLVEQLRLVVEGQADLREAHQRARKPEVALERDPDDRLAAACRSAQGAIDSIAWLWSGKNCGRSRR